jgi:proline iminopeptidase
MTSRGLGSLGHLAAVLVVVVACASRGPTPPVVRPPAVRTFQVDRPGARLAARAVGPEGAPLVFAIAGGPGYSHGYMKAFERLAEASTRMRVVTYDARGTGESVAAPDATFTLADTVADVDAVRAAAGAGAAVILGHSYGALVAEAYAIAHPERVRALVVVDGMPDRRADLGRAIDAARERALALGAHGLYHKAPPPAGDDCAAAMNAELPLDFADPRHPAARALEGTTCRASAGERTFTALGDYDLAGGLATLRVPVLVAFGDADPGRFELDVLGGQLAAATPAIATFAGCGHYPFLECPGPFFAKLEAFLATVP